jgi:hypothetical protein
MMESLKTVAIGGIDKHSMCFVGAADGLLARLLLARRLPLIAATSLLMM